MQSNQIALFDVTDFEDVIEEKPDLDSYDFILIMMSGGKDSLACLLNLIEAGVPLSKIEMWHHSVDGRGGDANPLFDWPVTESYCEKLAEAIGIPIYFSWKQGGLEGEMLREDAYTRPTSFETPDGTFQAGGESGKKSTRRKFPQLSANLSTRYCSAYLKVDPASKAITGQTRFAHKRTLFVTGERAEESSARSKYKTFEPHRTDRRHGRSKRHVDHYRPVHSWSEQEVWDIIKRHRINPHPAYKLGWGRLSCMTCIFGSAAQWASVKAIDPDRFERIANYEDEFGLTIHRTQSVRERVAKAKPYSSLDPQLIESALSVEFKESIIVDDWTLPAGAFGESNGPT